MLSFLVLFFCALNASFLVEAAVTRRGLVPRLDGGVISPSPNGGTYPRIARLSDGSLLAGYTAFNGANHILTVARSTDGGNSFSTWGTVATATNDLDNLHLVQLRDGRIVATFRNNDRNGNTYTWYRITACISSDNGRTWSFQSQVDERAAASQPNGLWEPFGRVARDGSLQVYYAAENNGGDQDILMKSSRDGGRTWSGVTVVAGGNTNGRDGMPGVTEFVENGVNKVMCIFETTEGLGRFSLKTVVSSDDGRTWGVRSQAYVATGTNNNAGAPQITTLNDGTLVASFMTDEDTSLHHWVDGASFKIITSPPVSQGRWGNKLTVSGVQSNWPGITALADGRAMGCADNGGPRCRFIAFS